MKQCTAKSSIEVKDAIKVKDYTCCYAAESDGLPAFLSLFFY